jgi:hypothetical protein
VSRLVLSNDYLSLFYSFILFSFLRSVLIDVCYGPFIADSKLNCFAKIGVVQKQIEHLTVKAKTLTIHSGNNYQFRG